VSNREQSGHHKSECFTAGYLKRRLRYGTGGPENIRQGQLSGSYFFDSGPLTQPDPLLNATHSVFSRRQMASAEETHIFSPQLVNTIRLGISRVRGDINLRFRGHSGDQQRSRRGPWREGSPQIGGAGLTPRLVWED